MGVANMKIHVIGFVMLVCMALYMTTICGHANHAFKVTLLGLIYIFRLLYAIRCFKVMACLGF